MLASVCMTGITAADDMLPFTDIKGDEWFYPYVSYAYNAGLMNGTGNGSTFSPMDKLTRGMVATVLYRNSGSPDTVFKYIFADIDDSTKYYATAAIWAYENGIVTGTGEDMWGDPYFSPDRNITRQELAAMFARYAKYKHVDTTQKTTDIAAFPDAASVADWATDSMKWVVGTGIITGKTSGGDTKLAPTDEATRAEYATIIQRFNTKDAAREFAYNTYYTAPVPISNYTEPEYPLVEDADIYVSTEGNDKTGDGSFKKPFATFKRAKERVNELKATAKDEIKVAFMAGAYEWFDTISFTSADSGSEGVPVIYCAYGDGEVLFNAGYTVPDSGFTYLDDSDKGMFPEEALGKIMKLDLAKYGVDVSKISADTDVFGGDTRLDLARYPNKSEDGSDNFIPQDEVIGLSEDASTMTLSAEVNDRIKQYHDIENVYMLGYYKYDWSAHYDKIKYYNPETAELRPNIGENSISTSFESDSPCPYFYFYNVPEELDYKGEYYIDKATGTLYAYAPSGDFTFAVGGRMMDMNGTEQVSFVGLTFAYSTEHCTNALETNHITFDRCNFRNLRGKGIYITGDDLTITGCEFTNVGNRGVEMISGDRETLTSGNSVIENCLFDNFGSVTKTGAAAIYAWGCGTRIAHNEICNSTNIGIFYSEYIWGSNDFIIEYNYIHDVLTQTSDSGAIYGGRNPAGHGTVIRYNIIDTTGNPKKGHHAVGIYLDDLMSGQEIYGNIIYGVTADYIFVNGGRENNIHDNIFIVPEYHGRGMIQIGQGQYSNVENMTESFTKPLTYWEELMICELVPFRSELWASRFPTLAKVTYGEDMAPYKDDINCLMNPSYNVVKDNAIFASKEALNRSNTAERERYAERVKLFSELEPCETYNFSENPYFVDPTHGEYTLVEGADIADNHFAKIGRY